MSLSSLFNSHLFDFTQGWTYVFGVGIIGGVALQRRQPDKDINQLSACPGRTRPKAQSEKSKKNVILWYSSRNPYVCLFNILHWPKGVRSCTKGVVC
jgi:hypothetical protein